MELHVLKIKNIASIADAEIDFSSAPLKDEPVFLICGDTGTGKSTILDAVCLALYNETPRMEASSSEKLTDDAVAPGKRSDDDTVKINDTRQFLRKGTGRGSVELTFAGNDLTDLRIKQISDEMIRLRQQEKQLTSCADYARGREDEMRELIALLDDKALNLTEYSDVLVRRVIERVTVLSREEIVIRFVGGMEMRQRVGKSMTM